MNKGNYWITTQVVNTISDDAGYSQRLEFEIKATEIPDQALTGSPGPARR